MTGRRIFWFNVLFGVAVCVIDLFVDFAYFYRGATLNAAILNAPAGELFMRLLVLLSFIGFGFYAGCAFTKQQRAKQQVETTLLFQQQLLDAIPAPVFYKDRAGVYLGCNRAFEQFVARERQQIVGKSVYQIAPADIAKTYESKDQELFNAPGTQIYEYVVEKKTGEKLHVMFHKATFVDFGGRVAGLIGVILDITERKSAEFEREKLIEKLQKALDEVKVLSGLLPICSSCKKVRDDSGFWNQIESYIEKRSAAQFSHSLCPDCTRTLYQHEPWYNSVKEDDYRSRP